ncbi:Putative peptidoglycan binding domain-containing protein [Friedmanniella luteola]|uniref:Putative peptidoglycan binding domain-containing protein n=1 Tax=Friedmanniella luteola TaxID=546871 RepID=A0A1H1XXP5_9ACTN|nr:M14 family zinc carboxypeptidase [Friedmanniella luteola]SDT14048.1 Putative peptidoglycan binding domain-containing protein [Friedmanniella luteola]
MHRPAPVRRARTAVTALLLGLAVSLPTGPAGAAPAAPAPAAPAPVSAVAAASAAPRYGQRSSAVRALQNRLIAAGLLKAELNTGFFGDSTRAAVRALQRKAGLSASGTVTAATDRALDRAVDAATGPRTWYHRETIGTSAEGRAIRAYRAGQPGKPVVVVLATMHGEENFGQYVARGLLEGRKIKGVDLWVVPVLNPDGLVRDRRWLRGGVDLNRNFPHRWIERANSGPKAVSAQETKVTMRFLDRVDPRYVVSWHQPLIGVDSYGVKDRRLMNRLSKGLGIKTRRLDCHGSCHGTMTGWFNAHHAGAAITIEYGSTARSMARMKGRDANAVLTAVGGRRG